MIGYMGESLFTGKISVKAQSFLSYATYTITMNNFNHILCS